MNNHSLASEVSLAAKLLKAAMENHQQSAREVALAKTLLKEAEAEAILEGIDGKNKELRDAALHKVTAESRYNLIEAETVHAVGSHELDIASLEWDKIRYLVRIYEADSRLID